MTDALSEMSHFEEYDYIVVNDQFARAVEDLDAVMRSQHLLLRRQRSSVPLQGKAGL
jgi:guanylate kinase